MDGINRTDADLVTLARSGDKEAFGLLVERHQPLATRLALRMVSNADIARELVQEGVLRAFLSLDGLREAARFGSWLCGIVLNVCRSYIRAEHDAMLPWEELEGGVWLADRPLVEAPPDPQEIAEERELHRIVLQAVHALPQGERSATLLFYYGQRSLQEIAALLGISVMAVKGRLYRAKGKLREYLWPFYAEAHVEMLAGVRRNAMTKAMVEDIRRVKDGANKRWAVIILVDEDHQRYLPIWVGEHEGEMLAAALRQIPTPRPLTITLITNLLRAAGSEVEEVRIEALKDNTFYAVVKLRTADGTQEVDARPSDALPLAVHLGKPIYVSDEVFAAAGLAGDDYLAKAKSVAQEKGMVYVWEESLLQDETR
ncbi:MAG: DUF151 domain-containing protein [Chloroflexi bacterium]|nr:DUF151 domain-containing protein [Chloroflexota bacterium]